MAVLTRKLPEWKIKQIGELAEKMRKARTVGLVDIKGLPAPQFHQLRSKLRNKMDIMVIKKTVIKFALEKARADKKEIEKLEAKLGEMPAVILADLGPFQISKLFLENVAPAFAKPGQIAPSDIVIQEGPTPFAAGPMISELSGIGLKVKVDAGKIVIQQPFTVAKLGEPIKANVADLLVKLGIQPMEVGLELTGAWENGFIFEQNILKFDINEYLDKLKNAAASAFNLTIGLVYPTRDNITTLISKAHRDARALGIEKELPAKELMPFILAKISAQANALNAFVQSKSS
jgi:large subunit ribosomal protein L10